jgi:hypothetical protein
LAIRFNSVFIAAFTACVICGFNEAISVMVLTGMILALPFVGRSRRRLVFAFLAGSFLSTILALVSPGNAIRRSDPNPIPDPLLIIDSLRQTGELLVDVALSPAGILLFVLALALAPYLQISGRIRPQWAVPIGVLLAISAITASVYGVHTLMARTALVPTFSLVATILVLGLWAGSRIIPRNAMILVLCTALFVFATGFKSLTLLPTMRQYERSWEAQNKALSEAGSNEHVIVERSLNPFPDAWQIQADPDWIVNRCVANYYGVASVQTAERP